MKLAHIVIPPPSGKHRTRSLPNPSHTQTIIEANGFAASQAQVELFTASYPEGRVALAPAEFIRTPDLEKFVQDYGRFNTPGKLPLIKDILERLYEATTADYLLYTNVDIGLQPYFYIAVSRLAVGGLRHIFINRRTISKRFRRVEEIPLMWAEGRQTTRRPRLFRVFLARC